MREIVEETRNSIFADSKLNLLVFVFTAIVLIY